MVMNLVIVEMEIVKRREEMQVVQGCRIMLHEMLLQLSHKRVMVIIGRQALQELIILHQVILNVGLRVMQVTHEMQEQICVIGQEDEEDEVEE